MIKTIDALNTLTENFAADNNVDIQTAQKFVSWFDDLGVIDYQETKNVYSN